MVMIKERNPFWNIIFLKLSFFLGAGFKGWLLFIRLLGWEAPFLGAHLSPIFYLTWYKKIWKPKMCQKVFRICQAWSIQWFWNHHRFPGGEGARFAPPHGIWFILSRFLSLPNALIFPFFYPYQIRLNAVLECNRSHLNITGRILSYFCLHVYYLSLCNEETFSLEKVGVLSSKDEFFIPRFAQQKWAQLLKPTNPPPP